jgi:hypothetical protein
MMGLNPARWIGTSCSYYAAKYNKNQVNRIRDGMNKHAGIFTSVGIQFNLGMALDKFYALLF